MSHYLLLFGAGASYGSDKHGTPPLGDKLFDALCRFHPKGWGSIPIKYSRIFRKDFEGGMVELSKQNSFLMPPLQRAMAAYFFNFYPKSSNLYLKLAERIKKSKWSGTLASLNYDRLLELSLIRMGIQPIIGGNSGVENQVELCLPHGCCHLFCEGVKATSKGVSFSGVGVTTNGPIKVISNKIAFQKRINEDAFPPVMSYFEPGKTTTSGSSFIRNQRVRWRQLVEDADIIGIIGVKVRDDDDHIWEPISLTSAKIVYCAGYDSGKEFENWRKTARSNSEDKIIYQYFYEAFDDISSELKIT